MARMQGGRERTGNLFDSAEQKTIEKEQGGLNGFERVEEPLTARDQSPHTAPIAGRDQENLDERENAGPEKGWYEEQVRIDRAESLFSAESWSETEETTDLERIEQGREMEPGSRLAREDEPVKRSEETQHMSAADQQHARLPSEQANTTAEEAGQSAGAETEESTNQEL